MNPRRLACGILDVVLHAMFWTGLPFCILCAREFTSPGRVAKILAGRMESASPLEACRGTVPEFALMDVDYGVYVQFPTSQMTREDRAYFDEMEWHQRTGFFWDALGAPLRLKILDEGGRVLPLTVLGVGVLPNGRIGAGRITVRYSIDAECEKWLAYHPKIRLIAVGHKDLRLARLGLAPVLPSAPWVVGRRLRRARRAGEATGGGTACPRDAIRQR